jgi:hypothetical protein
VRMDFHCADENTPYRPQMFPVEYFIDHYAPPGIPGYYQDFDVNLFCRNSVGDGPAGACFFYSPGRQAAFGSIAKDWLLSTPYFNGTLSDYTVTFRTANGHYLSARNGGGADVNAEATSPGPYEQFSLVDRTPGQSQLMDGDQVTLQSLTYDQAQWVAAEDGGGPGSVLDANRLYPHSWETFTIHKMNGTGAIYSGDTVSLKSINNYYVSADGGGGGQVTCDRTSALSWETLTVNISHN